MTVSKVIGLFFLCSFAISVSNCQKSYVYDPIRFFYIAESSYYFSKPPTMPRISCASIIPRKQLRSSHPFGMIRQGIKDMIQLNANLFTFDSLKILLGLLPVYLGARLIDEDIQCHFFTHKGHKNIHQFPKWCHDVAQYGLGIPIVLLGSQLFLSDDREWQEAAWFLLLGIPFVTFGKDVIKKLNCECCLRPWHEDFCKKNHKRCLGGFPSGHMAQAMFITVLYGMRFGPSLAVPLALYATALGAIFVNCNRHYVSQIVAGAALGTIYALAANKAINKKLSEEVNLNVKLKKNGFAVCCSYQF